MSKTIYFTISTLASIAPSFYNILDITPDNTFAKVATDGKVWLRTDSLQHYRQIQDLLHVNNIAFRYFNLPENQSLKVVIRGVIVHISVDEIQSD